MATRKVTDSQKKRVAAKQEHKCANTINTTTVPDYVCPFTNKVFDESGYDVDHIKELIDSGDNTLDNLQALCINCHRVKTLRFNSSRRLEKAKEPRETKEPKAVKQSAQPEKYDKHKIQMAIMQKLKSISLDDNSTWRIIENWGYTKQSALDYSDNQAGVVANLLGNLSSLQLNCRERTSIYNQKIAARCPWNEISPYISNVANAGEQNEACRDILREFESLLS
jgi:hypothetical protein